jgi:hypothetical protein
MDEHHMAVSFRPLQPSGGKAGVAWTQRRASRQVHLLMSPNVSADFGHHLTLNEIPATPVLTESLLQPHTDDCVAVVGNFSNH